MFEKVSTNVLISLITNIVPYFKEFLLKQEVVTS